MVKRRDLPFEGGNLALCLVVAVSRRMLTAALQRDRYNQNENEFRLHLRGSVSNYADNFDSPRSLFSLPR